MVTVKKGARELRVPESALQTYLNDGYSIANNASPAAPARPLVPPEAPTRPKGRIKRPAAAGD